MSGHRPWPVDPTKMGACDYDEITEAMTRHGRARRRQRKPYSIECRLVPTSDKSFVHGRYRSGTERDLAFAVLTGKGERELRGWSRTEWRKVG